MNYDPNRIYDADYRVTPDGQIEQASRRPSWLRRAFGPAAAVLLFVATKFKFLLTAAKGLKFMSTGFTALVSAGAYALLFPWQFAVGLVVLIFIHEMGHALMLRRYGVPATAPIFVPFMGAFIGMKQLPKNALMEAYVGLGGPVVGSIGAFAALAVYYVNSHPLFLVLAYFGVLLNLFNLLPVLPLDGGRAVGALSRWVWVVGYAALIGLVFLRPSPILLIILLLGAPEAWNALRGRRDAAYYEVAPRDRLAIAAIYFGLLLLLGFSFYELQHMVNDARLPR